MKKSIAIFLTAGALICSSVAFAAPKALSSAQLDSISAGMSVTDLLLPAATTDSSTTATNNEAKNDESTATATQNGTAVSGKDSEANRISLSGNVAVSCDDAVAGDCSGNEIRTDSKNDDNSAQIATGGGYNLAGTNQKQQNVKQEGDNALNAGDDAKIQVRVIKDTDDGSAAVVGDNNTTNVCTDKSEIDGQIGASNKKEYTGNQDSQTNDNKSKDGSEGVIARVATVDCSFNTQKTENEIRAEVCDSYDVTTNTLDLSGQGTVTAITNANTLCVQSIGVDVNVTNSATTVPTGEVGNGQMPSSDAETHQVQVNLVTSAIVVGLGVGTPCGN